MKIQLLSDLHLETHPSFVPRPAPDADVLVLAGDIGSYQAGSRLEDTDFGLARFSPRASQGAWPVPVLFVPGNHEYDAQDFDAARLRLRATCERMGLVWLDRETVVLDGVRFIGTTLWSDFDALASRTPANPAQAMRQRDKAYRAADFYLRKTGTTREGEPMLAPAVRAEALHCQQWLRTALAQPFDGPTVVVTHFAPSLRSADPRYGLVPGTAGFCNALDDLLPQATLWLHGHLHCRVDYVAQGNAPGSGPWRCRVAANPLGYAAKGEQDGFDPLRCIDTGPASPIPIDACQGTIPPPH